MTILSQNTALVENISTSNPLGVSQEEWQLRKKLADCYHLIDYFGWTETIFNHISARLPGKEHMYLVNPFGLNYDEVTAENLLKVDLDGNKVMPSVFDANPAGFALHSAVHTARDDIRCLIHTHTTVISAISQKKQGFKHDNFYGAQLYGRIGYHKFEGITLFAEERERMVKSMADRHILVLNNHGIAVGERSIETAFFLLWTVQRAAEIQAQADAMGGEDIVLQQDVQEKCANLTAMLIRDSGFADKFFEAMIRKMKASKAKTNNQPI